MEGSVDEMAELREHAAAQAALFNIGVKETKIADESMPKWPHRRVTRDLQVCRSLMPGDQRQDRNVG